MYGDLVRVNVRLEHMTSLLTQTFEESPRAIQLVSFLHAIYRYNKSYLRFETIIGMKILFNFYLQLSNI